MKITNVQHTPRFLTVKEAAIYLNVSTKTIRRLLERGLLKSSKALRKKLIPCTDLESFFQRTC
jgi:excisionase family DNA binding protein